ncbi:hypothetical protein LC526_000997 [Campylobacter jejuni]|nr:hypothetical protein [Campylobacter jejuni]
MDNKQQINKLRDMAELAQASYGYFHYVDNKFDIKDEDNVRGILKRTCNYP